MAGQGYNVYKVQYRLGMQDPMMGGGTTRYHTVIFVETDADKGGQIFHVTGDLVSGMRYEQKKGKNPEVSLTFHARTNLGRVRVEDLGRMDQVLRALPAPHRQRAFNSKTMRTEQIKPDGSFYSPDEQKPPFIKCTEWTEQRAIPALYSAQLLHNNLQQAPLA